MKTKLLLLISALLLFVSRPARAEVTFSFFYSSLAPYGDWVEAGNYGYCWRPANISADWRPYADGYWAHSDDGWIWVSYEDFGGITYHYGRWVMIEGEGWCWVPDYQWAPAWVSWRSSDSYVGWAPLPPEAHFEASIGFNFGVDARFDIGPSYYNFCETRYFGSPALSSVIIAPQRNVTIINETTNITNITERNKTIYNGGPDLAAVNRRSDRKIQEVHLIRKTDVDGAKGAPRNQIGKNGDLVVLAPTVKQDDHHETKPDKVARKIDDPKVDKGWNSVADEGTRKQIRQKEHDESGAPAGNTQADSATTHGGKKNGRGKNADAAPVLDDTTNPGSPAATADEPKVKTNHKNKAERANRQDEPSPAADTGKRKPADDDTAAAEAAKAERRRQKAAAAGAGAATDRDANAGLRHPFRNPEAGADQTPVPRMKSEDQPVPKHRRAQDQSAGENPRAERPLAPVPPAARNGGGQNGNGPAASPAEGKKKKKKDKDQEDKPS